MLLEQILIPTAILGGMGILFGAGLAFAGKKLAVKEDERIQKVRDCLPGAGCGACGYPGCDGYAAAVVNDGAPTNRCPVGGAAAAKAISEIMGVAVEESAVRMVATVICRGDDEHCKRRFQYEGLQECRAAFLASGGDKACKYACLGLGSCAKVCPFGAIHVENGLVHIDQSLCMGCKKCIAVCPKNVIRLEPENRRSVLLCRATEKGKDVREACTAGCITCGKCERACKFGAITMVDNLPQVDMEKCVGCLECVKACPTGAMNGDLTARKKATINEDLCVGCTLCTKQCKFDAISGELKGKHTIDAEKCVGCGQCAAKCPKKAITC